VYELAWSGDGKDGAPVLDGLIDHETLVYDDNRTGSAADLPVQNGNLSPTFRGASGVLTGTFRGAENGQNGNGHKAISLALAADAENAVTGSDIDSGPVVPLAVAR
jgi:hypothetical protein